VRWELALACIQLQNKQFRSLYFPPCAKGDQIADGMGATFSTDYDEGIYVPTRCRPVWNTWRKGTIWLAKAYVRPKEVVG